MNAGVENKGSQRQHPDKGGQLRKKPVKKREAGAQKQGLGREALGWIQQTKG